MSTFRVLYTTIEGNTESFVKKLQSIAMFSDDDIDFKEIGEETDYENEENPFVALVPTYLTGGTGTGPEVIEEFTTPLGEYIDYGNNARKLKGMIGSGNRNFNDQYILTAKRYAKKYNVPVIADYELRGTTREAEKIFQIIKETLGDN
ncbi:class Ib ribonucleoside-diphosphate reductase assembly flavoprotein NrdI [Fructobacillus sp. M2-14]|uniref:Class Ib ribonucleoside-diphosphate reductase assembly flavoprotein NrdI n=1 Tax=Fructobacillus broussonetiae TaxID=2713173 RepID=A0ABS5R1M2_9LACO|nr:class Ib ribonucleoside-diphosphate reductase assembly flavoprotein NrdI [Fructobacillus broussonetiae]MBS9338536.1 class Ib ribonucleoside-diphosphate reductase assembly flavoprotein NrdI [Fructobacillus broussonetiae]